jgi:flagellar biosynthesis protein FlhF
MLIRKYSGSNERVVLRQIRAELGSDAIILHTSFRKQRGFWKFVRPGGVDILAGGGFRIVKDYGSAKGDTARSIRPAKSDDAEMASLRKGIHEIKGILADQHEVLKNQRRFDSCPEDLAEAYLSLSESMSEQLAEKMIRKIMKTLPESDRKNADLVREALRGTLRDLVRCADGIQLSSGTCRRVAFIGPTGVGKTTTIAKLMSIYRTKYNKEVAVITNDTYRIAATEQIRRVAQLVGVPVRVCRTDVEMKTALDEFSNHDLVLLDTAGRSQKNLSQIEDLKRVLGVVRPDETHLVISLTAHPDTTAEVVERFQLCAFDRIVLTKVDETVKVGVVFDVLSRIQKDLSFITTGQEIPRDIEIADSGRIASLILGEEAI